VKGLSKRQGEKLHVLYNAVFLVLSKRPLSSSAWPFSRTIEQNVCDSSFKQNMKTHEEEKTTFQRLFYGKTKSFLRMLLFFVDVANKQIIPMFLIKPIVQIAKDCFIKNNYGDLYQRLSFFIMTRLMKHNHFLRYNKKISYD
jgi:hypothetical protein